MGLPAQFVSATPSATLTIALQGAPDNGSGSPGGWQTMQQTPAILQAQLWPGARPMKEALADITELLATNLNTTMTTTAGSTAATVASATGLLQGTNVNVNPNVIPGTTIASISGTAVTLSAAASASGTLVFTAFGLMPRPRFLRLLYTCSATFSAGSLFAGIVLSTDQPAIYPTGYAWPVSTNAI